MKTTKHETKKGTGDQNVRQETKKFLKTMEDLKPFLKKKSRRVYSNTGQWEMTNTEVC